MSKGYARGKLAWGECDRCSFRYPLAKLYYEVYDGKRNGLRVCKTCLDIDHEQLRLDEVDTSEAISLRDPRPPKNVLQSRSIFGFNPVVGKQLTVRLGTVQVTTT